MFKRRGNQGKNELLIIWWIPMSYCCCDYFQTHLLDFKNFISVLKKNNLVWFKVPENSDYINVLKFAYEN
jgi:hypothetical protein